AGSGDSVATRPPARCARRPRGRDGARTADTEADGTDVPHVGATGTASRLSSAEGNARESFRRSLLPPGGGRRNRGTRCLGWWCYHHHGAPPPPSIRPRT